MTGVLLVNLGTTEAPTPRAVRRYLREFLSDRMVVDRPPKPIWWLILNLFILPRRPKVVAPLYEKIWLPEGAPLVVYTRRQRDALAARLGRPVGWGMRYGTPSILDAMRSLKLEGCSHIVALPMFPQVSRSNWTTAVEAIEKAANKLSLDLGVVPHFFDHPGYINALATRVRAELEGMPEAHVLMSFHGIPKRFLTQYHDPYEEHCRATASALATALGLSEGIWTLAYQSQFGREEWLKPATADVVKELAKRHPRVLAVCPGFPADCLETVDEIGNLARESFLEHGGKEFRLVPGLNNHPAWIDGIQQILEPYLGESWLQIHVERS